MGVQERARNRERVDKDKKIKETKDYFRQENSTLKDDMNYKRLSLLTQKE